MTEQQYNKGDIIFTEGENSDVVYRIISGEAEVTKQQDGQFITVGRVGPGEYVGEMGAIADRRRSATIRAVSELRVERVDRDNFLKRVSQDSELAFQLLGRLGERLRVLGQTYAETASTSATETTATAGPESLKPTTDGQETRVRIRILPGSETVAAAIPQDGIEIDHLPYRVGRKTGDDEEREGNADLRFEDSQPYRLSRTHFAIMRRNGKNILYDLDSTLGTQVNGKFVGRFFSDDSIALNPGENTVVAGGSGSTFMFKVLVEPN